MDRNDNVASGLIKSIAKAPGIFAMAFSLNRLSPRAVQTLAKPGRHADGGNLYLVISDSGSRSWLFIYRQGKRQREMGLGSVRGVPLARARVLATEGLRR